MSHESPGQSTSAAEIESLLDAVPILATRPRVLEVLPGGLTNTNVKVSLGSGTYVARISGANAKALGIDRFAEHKDSFAAASTGVGAEVVAFDPDLGVLVIGWIEGRTLTNLDVPSRLPAIADALRRLHAGPRFTHRFDMFERQGGYLTTVREHGIRIPDGYDAHVAAFARVRTALAVHDEGTVPCNNDLLAGNLIETGPDGDQGIRVIDYEYAGNNDACFELGNLAGECELAVDELDALVTAYFGEPRPDKLARARLQCAVGQYGWTLWGCIQAAVSPLDVDFWEWGVERYEKAAATFTGDDLSTLLDEVAR